jgi:type I restriction enzyme S subunit
MYGATAAKSAINKIPLTTNQACCNLQINPQKARYRYVYYWLCYEYLRLKSLGRGSQDNLNADMIKNYPIVVPTLDVQDDIIATLDKYASTEVEYEKSIQNEIQLRQVQYEYYRDKLLTFEEAT